MSTVKVQEMKNDAIIEIKVNKNYYLMVKATLFDLFTILTEKGSTEESLKSIANRPYAELTPNERSFYTVTLLLAEIEKQAKENNLYDEKDFDAEKFLEEQEKSSED
jgi:hypothetical protein